MTGLALFCLSTPDWTIGTSQGIIRRNVYKLMQGWEVEGGVTEQRCRILVRVVIVFVTQRQIDFPGEAVEGYAYVSSNSKDTFLRPSI